MKPCTFLPKLENILQDMEVLSSNIKKASGNENPDKNFIYRISSKISRGLFFFFMK